MCTRPCRPHSRLLPGVSHRRRHFRLQQGERAMQELADLEANRSDSCARCACPRSSRSLGRLGGGGRLVARALSGNLGRHASSVAMPVIEHMSSDPWAAVLKKADLRHVIHDFASGKSKCRMASACTHTSSLQALRSNVGFYMVSLQMCVCVCVAVLSCSFSLWPLRLLLV